MNTRHKYITWLRPLFLSLLLLATGGSAVWGDNFKIEYKGTGRQENVPEKVDTLFLGGNYTTRDLFIPEFKRQKGKSYDDDYRWYIRWYIMNDDNEFQSIEALKPLDVTVAGEGTYKTSLKKEFNNNSWYFYGEDSEGKETGETGSKTFTNYARGASKVQYTHDSKCLEMKIIAEVSLCRDYVSSPDGKTLTEPTLSKRYVYVIADADERAKQYDTDGYVEEYTFTVPAASSNGDIRNINLQMPTFPYNYYWYVNGQLMQGQNFFYTIEGKRGEFDSSQTEVVILKGITENTQVEVFAENGNQQHHVATFDLIMQEGAGFVLQENVKDLPDPKRNPSEHPELYEQVGYFDFDIPTTSDEAGNVKSNVVVRSELASTNNMLEDPMDKDQTSYAFLYPTILSTNNNWFATENQYGLYRSANVTGISKNRDEENIYDTQTRTHRWYFADTGGNPNEEVYDLTYYNSPEEDNGNKKCGFFYYINASNEPGRIVNVPITGQICGGTELLVTAWINDMTTAPSGTITANVNFNFIATDPETGETEVLHRFTSRDALENYVETTVPQKPGESPTIRQDNKYVGKWQQLCYTFSVDQETINKYGAENCSLEVQNNTAHTSGADYAIDDIRIYRTIPRAEARQANSFCDDRIYQIEFSMDYDKLLTVLALHPNDDVPADYNTALDEWATFAKEHPEISNETTKIKTMRKVQYYIFKVLDDWKQSVDGGDLAGLNKFYTFTNIGSEHIVTTNKDGVTLGLNYELIDAIIQTRNSYYETNPDAGKKFPGNPNGGDYADKFALYDCFEYFVLHYDNNSIGTATIGGLSFISTDVKNMHDDISETDMLATYIENEHKVYFQNILVPEKEIDITTGYYIAYIPTEENADAKDFNDRCGLITPFKLEAGRDIVDVVDGATTIDEVTGNQEYTFKGKFWKKEDGVVSEDETVLFDWFFGTMDEFQDPDQGVVGNNGASYSVREALDAYHKKNTDENWLALLKEKWEDDGVITDSGDEVDLTTPSSTRPKLIIEAKQVKLETAEGENNFPMILYPAAGEGYNDTSGAFYCLAPRLVNVGGDPIIKPGDPELPDYPTEDYDGFAVRLGMEQIHEMVKGTEKTMQTTPLQIPIFNMHHSDPDKGQFGCVKNDNIPNQYSQDVKVIATNDDLWGKATLLDDDDADESSSIVVAQITELALPNKGSSEELTWNNSYFQLTFNEKAKNFREGYYYKLNVPFYELVFNKSKDEDNIETKVDGGEYLTGFFNVILKIVPKYVTWSMSGEGNHNWNNDELWRRSTAADLHDGEQEDRAELYPGGTAAYVPMRFTNVIVQNDNAAYSAYPYLYELNTKGTKKTEETEEIVTTEEGTLKDHTLDMTLPQNLSEFKIGDATKNIEYDLAVDEDYMKTLFDKDCKNDEKINFFTCVRFYGNTCNEIYFKPQTALLHSEYLTYEKAWVDYELAPNRWYTLASPLKGIASGDMYLPKTGRQTTPAFTPITYNADEYTRWDPAVYMRGWDKRGTGSIVVKDGDGGIQYGAANAWSNLYNKVSEPFTPGTGFSIGVKTEAATTTSVDNQNVIFRLPKADTKYSYFDKPATKVSEEKPNDDFSIFVDGKNRKDYGRLAVDDMKNGALTVPKSEDEDVATDKLQLVGNPFMAHLDMQAFFGKEGGKYYILEKGDAMTAYIQGKGYSISTAVTTDSDDPLKVAPLQSFLVAKADVQFTTDMQTIANTDGTSGLRSATVSKPKNKLSEIRITAQRGDKQSTSVVAYLSYASSGYGEEEDASLLISKEGSTPQVYTVADKQMLAINLTDRIHNIPVGVYGTDDSPVTLTFSISDKLSNVTLYDKQEKKSYPVTEGMTLTVPGNTSGRYVLNGSVPTANEVIATNQIVCYSSGGGRIDISSVDPLTRITVYNFSGQLVTGRSNLNTPTTYIDGLTPGQIYIVKTETANQTQTEKVEVR